MKRRAADAGLPDRNAADDSVLEITPLGSGNEVGRSCILLRYKGKTVLLDCGVHPAYTGLASLPFFDAIDDPSAIDLLLVSQCVGFGSRNLLFLSKKIPILL
jgi:cleavage and polyadenylation specificity factor subunit 3